jgi:hypothetical protein
MTEYNISRQALWLFCGFVVSLTLVGLALPCGAVAGLALGVVRQLTAWEHCPAEQRGGWMLGPSGLFRAASLVDLFFWAAGGVLGRLPEAVLVS